jgi:hypothetical protein
MAPPRKKKGASASPYQLPTGAVLLGELRTVLGLPVNLGRTTHRLEAGEVVEEEAIAELSLRLGEALVVSGVVPTCPQIAHPELLLAFGIHALVRQWSHATMALRSGEQSPLDARVMTLAAAQLIAVDIAIRVGVWTVLLGAAPERLSDVDAPTIAGTMADAIRRTGLTQGKLCRILRVPPTTVRRWIRGSRPRDSTLSAVAELINGDPAWTSHAGDLRRRIICASALEKLTPNLPPQDIGDVWRAFTRISRATARFLSDLSEPECLALCRAILVDDAENRVESLLVHLLQAEPDQRWRPPIHSMRDWSKRLVFARGIAHVVASTPTDFKDALGPLYKMLIDSNLAESTIDLDRLTNELSRRRPELEAHLRASSEEFRGTVARRQGQATEAVSHMKAATVHEAADRNRRLRVVYALAEAGNLRDALALASEIGEHFDATLLKATLLISSGNLEEGKLELERLASTSKPSAELLVHLGVARWRCRDFCGALDVLELAIESAEFQHDPTVLDIAAECAFEIGSSKKGMSLARRANLVGCSRTYLGWKLGVYSSAARR